MPMLTRNLTRHCKLLAMLAPFLLATGAQAAEAKKPAKTFDNGDGHSLTIEADDDARQIIDLIPLEAVQERLEWIDPDGHALAYLALTETREGGLLFLDGKLAGTLTRRDAQAFYACRAYVTATQGHWARQAGEWLDSLRTAGKPAAKVNLVFSGQSTSMSVKEVGADQTFSQLESLVNIGTNPLGILRKLNSANDSKRERERLERIANALRAVTPGTTEEKLFEAQKPEEVLYAADSLVLAYPRFAWEFVVAAGSVRLAQQPSFHSLAKSRSALFYIPGTQWQQCTPKSWRQAVPEASAKDASTDQNKPPAAK